MKRILISFWLVLGSVFLHSALTLATEGGPLAPVGAGPAEQNSKVYYPLEFLSFLEANRSYSCTALPAVASLNQFGISAVTDGSGNAVTFLARGGVSPVNPSPDNDGSNLNDPPQNLNAARVTLTPAASGFYRFTVSGQAIDYSDTEKVRFTCEETTLFGGYNIVVNAYNFLELTNTTNSTIDTAITVIDFNGTTVVSSQSRSIAPNTRGDFDVHTPVMNAGAGAFGSIIITHNGPYGAVRAAVSQYLVAGDGSFTLAQSIPVSPRDRSGL